MSSNAKTATTTAAQPARVATVSNRELVITRIIPPILGELLNDKDSEKSSRVMQAMLKMSKLDIRELKKAALKSARWSRSVRPSHEGRNDWRAR